MKRRYLCVLLFAVPALLASIIVSLALFAAAAGVLWLFVLGDNPWPGSAGDLLVSIVIVVGVTSWVSLMSVAYFFGKKQEANAGLNTKHVLASAGATTLLVALVALHQWSVGNIGPKSSGLVCAEFCQGKGFAGSSMPPADGRAATCSCLDAHGQEAVKVTMEEIAAERRQ